MIQFTPEKETKINILIISRKTYETTVRRTNLIHLVGCEMYFCGLTFKTTLCKICTTTPKTQFPNNLFET